MEYESEPLPNILIVDDNPVNLGVIVEYLEEYGYRLRIARSGIKALERAANDPPDLILLDVMMPEMDGYETCERLKQNPNTRDIPVMFITSLSSVDDKVRAFELGAVDFVTKPLHQEEVLVRIKAQLEYVRRTRLLQAQKEQIYRSLTQQLNDIQEVERHQLARELHDEVGQILTALKLNLSMFKRVIDPEADVDMEYIDESIHLTEELLEQIRDVSLRLRPLMLDDLGLEPTIRWLVKSFTKRTEIPVNLQINGFAERVVPQLETALYRIVQESLTNVTRYAEASHVNVNLTNLGDRITLFVEDDGKGFDATGILDDTQRSGLGLHGIKERVNLLDGQFDIQSEIGAGTQILVDIPIYYEDEY